MKFYTIWICLIIIMIFALQLSVPGFTDSLVLNQQSFIQPWRFITSIFLHASPSHLIFNLFALVLFGLMLEKLATSNRLLLVFFISGVVANLISVNFYSSSLGASGAIMGIIGFLAITKPLMMVWAFGLIMPMFVAALLWIVGDILGMFIPSNTGNIAHLSGIAVGILFGLSFRLKTKKAKKLRYIIKIPEDYMRDWENRYVKR